MRWGWRRAAQACRSTARRTAAAWSSGAPTPTGAGDSAAAHADQSAAGIGQGLPVVREPEPVAVLPGLALAGQLEGGVDPAVPGLDREHFAGALVELHGRGADDQMGDVAPVRAGLGVGRP